MHRIKRIHQVLHKPLLLLSNEAWGLHHTLTERHENRIPHSQDRTALTGADYKWVFIGEKKSNISLQYHIWHIYIDKGHYLTMFSHPHRTKYDRLTVMGLSSSISNTSSPNLTYVLHEHGGKNINYNLNVRLKTTRKHHPSRNSYQFLKEMQIILWLVQWALQG